MTTFFFLFVCLVRNLRFLLFLVLHVKRQTFPAPCFQYLSFSSFSSFLSFSFSFTLLTSLLIALFVPPLHFICTYHNMPMTTDPPPFTICSNETISVNSSLRQNEQQLWKIVEKQRSVIQDLQEELSRARIDRNNLLTQLETARQQLLQLEKCNGHEYQEPPAVVDDDQQSPLRGSQSSSSSGSSSNSSCPVPPPRSPYRQHNCSADLQDSSAAGASPTVVRPAKSMDETTAMDPSSPPRSSFTSSRPVSPTFKKSRSPVSVILDKDAQVFAKYQESLLLHSRKDGQQQQRDTRLWSPPPPRPPAPPPHQQHQRHVRRASSQPAISQNPPPQHFFATAKDEMPPASKVIENSLDELSVKVLGSNITTNHKGKGVISFTISVQRGSDELWRIEKLYSDFLALDAQLKSINKVRSRESKVNKLPDKALFATHTPNKANQRKVGSLNTLSFLFMQSFLFLNQ